MKVWRIANKVIGEVKNLNGCKEKNIKFYWLIILIGYVIGITSCSNQEAPIVDGWQQTAGKRSHYTVQKGDTLYSVAWGKKKIPQNLMQLNNIVHADVAPTS